MFGDTFSKTSAFAGCFPDNVQMGRPRLGVRVWNRFYGVLPKKRTRYNNTGTTRESHSVSFFSILCPLCCVARLAQAAPFRKQKRSFRAGLHSLHEQWKELRAEYSVPRDLWTSFP